LSKGARVFIIEAPVGKRYEYLIRLWALTSSTYCLMNDN
jgi:hypothetical protein